MEHLRAEERRDLRGETRRWSAPETGTGSGCGGEKRELTAPNMLRMNLREKEGQDRQQSQAGRAETTNPWPAIADEDNSP